MGRRQMYSVSLLLYFLSGATNAASESTRPRGVGPDFAKYYKDTTTFTCVSNPSVTIPFSRVNDDYCDCPDGSDEPGTSACASLSPLSPSRLSGFKASGINHTLVLPGFYCKNKGHRPSYVPFTSVNDGTCDYELCCDGSEEYDRVGGVKCDDQCTKIGKEWKKQDDARQKSMDAARRRRKELVIDAGRLQKEVEDRIGTLQTQIEGQTLKVEALTKSLADIEREARGRVVRGSGTRGQITVLASLTKERIRELTESANRLRQERDAAVSTVQELEDILKRFKEEYNPNFNDEGVKRAVKGWEDFAAQMRPRPNYDLDSDFDDMQNPESASAINWAEFEAPSPESDIDVLYKFEEYLPAPVRDWVDAKLRDLRLTLIDNGILAAPESSSEPESKTVSDARAQLESAKNELESTKTELANHQGDAEKDYGPDGVFRALKDVCVEADSGEYTYEHCFLSRTSQRPKNGGGHTGMGNFASISVVTVDDELPANGKGLGSGNRIALKYDNGQHCWNGPNRSTMVILACAEKDEIWKIVEEEKCVYRMEMGSPAVCGVEVSAPPPVAHDEL